MNIKDRLTISITTNFIKSAPSTSLIRKILNNLYWRFPNLKYCPLIISCDIFTAGTSDKIAEYIQNLKKLNADFPSKVLVTEKGFRQSMLNIFNEVKTPYLLSSQHDWLFVKDINFEKLLDVFNKYKNINYIGFNKRNNVQKGMDYILKEEKEIAEIPLLKSSRLSMNPHIVRISECRKKYTRILKDSPMGTKVVGTQIEKPLWGAYVKEVREKGFDTAHKNWGIYLYGNLNDNRVVDHLDGRHWLKNL